MPEIADSPYPILSSSTVTQLTLTTFAHVPWNAPYYLKLGFHPMRDDALGPQLAAELSQERARFTAPRIAMACPV